MATYYSLTSDCIVIPFLNINISFTVGKISINNHIFLVEVERYYFAFYFMTICQFFIFFAILIAKQSYIVTKETHVNNITTEDFS